ALTLACGYDPQTTGNVDPESLKMEFYSSSGPTRTDLDSGGDIDTTNDIVYGYFTTLTTNTVELQGTDLVSTKGGNSGAIFVQATRIEAPVNQPHPGCQFYLYAYNFSGTAANGGTI